MDIFLARQPILNQKRKLFGYELLFRDSMENYMPLDIDGDVATSSVLSRSFLSMGLEKVSGSKTVFINFTQNLILKQVPAILPAKLTVIEILENIIPDQEVIKACTQLKKKGYRLAIDDYIFQPEMTPFLGMVDIIKIDFMQLSLDEIYEKIDDLPDKAMLLAEKVESWREFNAAKDMGFELFQGYFFCKPEIVKGKDIPASTMAILEILAEVNKQDLNFDTIVPKISRDVSISYKLLKYMNSAFFQRPQKITSIKDALTFLGQEELRRFVSVILMTNMASAGISELAISSCVRAKFCELLGGVISKYKDQEELFTLGLFSLIDAILDQPMEKIMGMLPLSNRITDTLVSKKGDLVELLELVICFEKGDWEKVEILSANLGVTIEELPLFYMEAVEWADALGPL